MIQLDADFTSALPEILHRFCECAVACFKGTCHRLRGAKGVYTGGVFAGAEADEYEWLAQGEFFCGIPAPATSKRAQLVNFRTFRMAWRRRMA